MLAGRQLEEFRWDVKQYIRAAKKADLSPEWQRKLENASARFHVSRLESVQLAIQQQLELLFENQLDALDAHLRDVVANGYTQGCYELQKGIGIGWDVTGIDRKRLEVLLSKPWTNDGKTFRDRCWEGKANLVSGIQTHLVQALLRGDSLRKTTDAVAERFGVSRYKAGRLVHTETTYFNAVASLETYREFGVENVEIIETLDTHTCEICAPMDGKVIPLSQYEPGVTVPPFHPNCRGTTAPAIDDDLLALDKEINGGGERAARDAKSEKTFDVPADMTYEEWKARQDAIHGAGTVDLERKKHYNRKADSEQLKKYQSVLGKDGGFSDLKSFQTLKYENSTEWEDAKGFFEYKKGNPESDRAFYEGEKARKELLKNGIIRATGTVVDVPKGIAIVSTTPHATKQLTARGLTEKDAKEFVDNALFAIKQRNGEQFAFYSENGFAVVSASGELRTAGTLDSGGKVLFEEVKKYVTSS